MAIDIKLRLYDFPSKVGTGIQSLAFKEGDTDGNSLTTQVATLLDVSSDRLSIIFRGKLIKPKTRLKSLNLQSGQLLQVMYKPSFEEENLFPDLDANRLKMTMVGLHLIFWGRRQDHRGLKKNVLKLLKDSKRLQKIIDGVPGLKNQPITTDILRHPDIFGHVVEPTNFDKILQSNKQLGAAILQVWDNTPSLKSVKDLLTAAASSSRPSSSRVSPREDYDDEEMDTELSYPAIPRPQGDHSPGVITSNQLARALSMASSRTSARSSSRVGSGPQSAMQSPQTASGASSMGSRSASGAITSDVFSMAMQQALALSNNANTTDGISQQQSPVIQSDAVPTLSREAIERGMEQLRSMGIADEEASRQALIAGGGNVEAAVNILFASGLNDL